MDSSLAGVLGSVVGSAGTLVTTWLNAHLTREKPDLATEESKRILLELLEHPIDDWCHMHTLSNVVGLDEKAVRRILLEIGARGSANDGNLWGLVARHPLDSVFSDPDSKAAVQEVLDRLKRQEVPNSDAHEPTGAD